MFYAATGRTGWRIAAGALLACLVMSACQTPGQKRLEQALRDYTPVILADLSASPRDFLGRKVVFDAYYARKTDLYPTFPTPFSRTDYVNFSVWPHGAKLWRAQEMGASYPYLYIARDSGGIIDPNAEAPLKRLDGMSAYDGVRVYGTVVLDNNHSGWVVVDTFRSIEGVEVKYCDALIHRLKLADENFTAKEFPVAVKDYNKALAIGVPAEVEGEVRKGLGLSHLVLENWTEAAVQLDLAVKMGTNDPECLLGLAEAQIELGLPAEAEQNARLALEKAPRSPVGRADLAIAVGRQGRTAEGLAECAEALKLAPANADVLRARGLVEDLAGKLDVAIATYQAAADSRPTDPRIHLELGRLFLKKGDQEKAALEFGNVVKTASATYPLPYCRGNCLLGDTLMKLKKPAEAEACYLDAQKRDELYIPAYLGLGALYSAAGPDHFDKALQNYRVVAEQLCPAGDDGFTALNRMAGIYHVRAEQEKDATCIVAEADCYQKAAAIKPDDYDNWMNLALTRWHQTPPDRKAALAALAECARVKPEESMCHFLAGNLHLETDNLTSALVELETAKRLAPKDAATLLSLAQVLRLQGNDGRALIELRAAAGLEAGEDLGLSIRNSLAYALADAGLAKDAAEALKLAADAAAARPDSISFQDTLGWAQARFGKPADALKTLGPVAAKAGDADGEIRYHLGYALAAQKNYPAAIAVLTKASADLAAVAGKSPRAQRLASAAGALLNQCKTEHSRAEAERARAEAEQQRRKKAEEDRAAKEAARKKPPAPAPAPEAGKGGAEKKEGKGASSPK